MNRILVTGTTGFVGHRLAHHLRKQGYTVFGLIHDLDLPRKSFQHLDKLERVFTCDLRNFSQVENVVATCQPEAVVHLGAVTQVPDAGRYPLPVFQTNVMGTMNVLEACRRFNPGQINIVVASSDKVYGKPTALPLTTDHPFNVAHPYDASKAAAEMIIRSYVRQYHERIVVLRPANIYGPGDENWQRLVPGTIRSVLTDQDPIIRSNGYQVRQYLYIDDACDAYRLTLERLGLDSEAMPPGSTWNVASNDSCNARGMVQRILSISGKDHLKAIILNEAKDETQEVVLDDAPFRQAMHWSPRITHLVGLQRTLDWVAWVLS